MIIVWLFYAFLIFSLGYFFYTQLIKPGLEGKPAFPILNDDKSKIKSRIEELQSELENVTLEKDAKRIEEEINNLKKEI